MTHAVLIVALVGCGPPVDPLAATRQAYADALARPVADEPAHAVVRASDDTLGAFLGDLAVGAPIVAPGPFGMNLVLIPEVTQATAHTQARDPLEVRAELAGTTDIVFPLMSADDLGWTVAVEGALTSWTSDDHDGLHIGLKWHDPEALRVTLGLDGAPEQVSALAEGAVRGTLTGLMGEQGIGFTLPHTPWARVRDLRLRGGDEGLTAELVLSGTQGAPPPPPEVPQRGIVLAVSDDTLLGVAQALAADQQLPDDKLVVEPRSLQLHGQGIVAELRVHRKSRRPKWRTYRLEAPLIWEGSTLSLPVESLELVGHERWRGGWRVAIGEKRAVELLQQGLADVPTALSTPVGERVLHLELIELQTMEGALHFVGVVDLP